MIYLDNHTASRPCGPALEQMRAALDEHWKLSLPKMPLDAADLLDARYPMIYDLAGADPADSFVFTSSGAEAINQVHWTAFAEIARKEGKCHFVTSSAEDAPTLQSLKRLEELGCFVKIAPLDSSGRIDLAKFSEQLGPRTALVSVSMAHGLTGVIQPIDEIARLCKEKGAYLHVDATYALGKLYCPFQEIGADYLTFSGDRIHSVKGSAGIFVKKGRPMTSLVLGATLDVPSALALCAAASHASLSLDVMSLEVARLRDRLEDSILQQIPDAISIFRDAPRLPNVSVLAFPRVHQEALLYLLQRKNISASIGGLSAPHLHRHLMSCGIEEKTAQTALSFSLSRFTTQEEIDRAVATIVESVTALRSLSEDLF